MRPRLLLRPLLLMLLISLVAASCGSADETDDTADADNAPVADETTGDSGAVDADSAPAQTPDPTADPTPAPTPIATPEALEGLPAGVEREFGEPPAIPEGPLADDVAAAVDVAFGNKLIAGEFDTEMFTALRELGSSGDPRIGWLLTDLLRIARDPDLAATLADSLAQVLEVPDLNIFDGWNNSVDHLIAWDVPAPPDYLRYKRNVYLLVEPTWDRLFVESDDVDWRLVSWGGVFIDDRDYDMTDVPCNCIPAADNPRTTDATVGDNWLDDDTIVFGVVINDEARAYPRSIMEVREMVNDTLGGRDIAMPYCTLCGSAQVYFTDEVPEGVERPILRTSGLLSRSNKVMYDVRTFSIFDTFLGTAVTGPLADAGIELRQNSVLTTTWGQWKADHPDTTVLAIEEALGRPDSDLRNTRDADGPIFPIGDVDPRLPVQEDVLGLLTAEGDPIAFHVESARVALLRGETIEVEGIVLTLDGGGIKASGLDGNDLGGHQAFWFAWSQFYPGTALWPEA